jgi:hypothetical protein
VAFEFADDEGLLLLDMDDLRTTLQYLGDNAVDRESAHELLRERAEKAPKQAQARDAKDNGRAAKKPGRRRQSIGEAFIKSLARTVGNQIGRQLMRGILGSLKR